MVGVTLRIFTLNYYNTLANNVDCTGKVSFTGINTCWFGSVQWSLLNFVRTASAARQSARTGTKVSHFILFYLQEEKKQTQGSIQKIAIISFQFGNNSVHNDISDHTTRQHLHGRDTPPSSKYHHDQIT